MFLKLPSKAIAEFKEIWKKKYGEISDKEAERKASEFISHYALALGSFMLPDSPILSKTRKPRKRNS